MIVVKIAIFGIIGLLFSIGMIAPSFAHTTVEVGEYKLKQVGELNLLLWELEMI